MPNPTSIRFTDAELALIRVHAARLEQRTGKHHTPSDVARWLLRSMTPKDGATGPLEPEFRRAYTDAFGDRP